MDFPSELKYTSDHEWIKLDGDIATIGITAFAQGELGDIVYVDIDSIGDELDQNEVFGTIEAVKTVSDLFLPVTGEVLEFNESLEDAPEKVNEDPYGEGWLIKMKVSDISQVEGLLTSEAYQNEISA